MKTNCISIEILLKFVPVGPNINTPALFQIIIIWAYHAVIYWRTRAVSEIKLETIIKHKGKGLQS